MIEFLLVLLLTVITPGVTQLNGEASNPTTVYGTNPRNPLVSNATINIVTSGPATIRSNHGEVEYGLGDHLGSGRVVIGSTTPTFNEYAPYGRPDGSANVNYTGKNFDPATLTYDFLARQYDPSLGGFLGRDPRRSSASPYPYAGGNPVNYLDPDGRAPMHFFMHSIHGVDLPDHTGTHSLYDNTVDLEWASNDSRHWVARTSIEGTTPIGLPDDFEAGHLTLSLHGDPGVAYVWDTVGHGRASLNGHAFANYLHSQMTQQFGPSSTEGLRSINIASCFGACRTRSSTGSAISEDSFADVFVRSARPFFPGLESVVASPYVIGLGAIGPDWNRTISFEIEGYTARRRDVHDNFEIRYEINPDDFFAGQFPDYLLTTPSQHSRTVVESYDQPIRTVFERRNHGETTAIVDPSQIRDLVHQYRDAYPDPALRRIFVPPVETE